VEPNATSSNIDALILIWERVLQRSSIHADDNFFDLGGNPLLAARLLAEIERLCGRELPRFLIYHAPTVSALAALLEQSTLPGFPALIPLKAGVGWPPVFVAPGAGAHPLDYFQLARHTQTQHPIFALLARGLDRMEAAFERIEDMAQYYLGVIKGLQPQGPYLLVGFSFGGLVALEMAQQLTANGEKVAMLVMLESYPAFRFLSLSQRIRLTTRRAKHHALTSLRLPVAEAFSYLFRRAKRRLSVPENNERGRPPDGISLSTLMKRLRNSDFRALARYRPRSYNGSIRFVKAAISTNLPDDPAAAWANLAREFKVETVPGDHNGIITKHYEKLAAVLSRYLSEASC
jgi:acetoacetyl-CoA synthetase